MRLPAEIREVVVPVRLLVKSSNIVLYACHLHSCYRYIIMYKKVHWANCPIQRCSTRSTNSSCLNDNLKRATQVMAGGGRQQMTYM